MKPSAKPLFLPTLHPRPCDYLFSSVASIIRSGIGKRPMYQKNIGTGIDLEQADPELVGWLVTFHSRL